MNKVLIIMLMVFSSSLVQADDVRNRWGLQGDLVVPLKSVRVRDASGNLKMIALSNEAMEVRAEGRDYSGMFTYSFYKSNLLCQNPVLGQLAEDITVSMENKVAINKDRTWKTIPHTFKIEAAHPGRSVEVLGDCEKNPAEASQREIIINVKDQTEAPPANSFTKILDGTIVPRDAGTIKVLDNEGNVQNYVIRDDATSLRVGLAVVSITNTPNLTTLCQNGYLGELLSDFNVQVKNSDGQLRTVSIPASSANREVRVNGTVAKTDCNHPSTVGAANVVFTLELDVVDGDLPEVGFASAALGHNSPH